VIGFVALFAQATPMPASAAQTWTKNLYTWQAFLYQDPYATACTAAATMIMLNTIAYRQTGGEGFRWTSYRVKNNTRNRADYRDMTSILWFERAHDTLSAFGSGSDGHGWRNALNYYGWGGASMTDPAISVYEDLEYTSYDAAVHAAVLAIARYEMPVGILAWGGRHAQVMTGYVVDGEDPATSDAFTVQYVYLSDPLYGDHYVNAKVSNASFKAGSWRVRFQSYRETDSPYDDTYKPGWRRSAVTPSRGPSEWYGRWVIVAPIRAVLSTSDPDPTPSPTPTPTPTPDPTPDPTPTPSDAPPVEPPPSPASSPDGSIDPALSAEPSPAP
jgi:hypothetical protein